MASKANTSKSAKYFTDYSRSGLTLKSHALKTWLKRKGYEQSYFAERLGMSKDKFRQKLYKRQTFDQNEITALIRLMGARAAIKVIWFPNLEEKRRIQNYVWEKQMNNKHNSDFPDNYETPAERKEKAIAELADENGEDWDQTDDFLNLIFESDELPSRRFMRRRNDKR